MPKTNTRIPKGQKRVTAAKTATDTSSTSGEEGDSVSTGNATSVSMDTDFAKKAIHVPPAAPRIQDSGRPITTSDVKNVWVIGGVISTVLVAVGWAAWWMSSISTTITTTSDDLKEVKKQAESINNSSTRNTVRVDHLETRTLRLESKVDEFQKKKK